MWNFGGLYRLPPPAEEGEETDQQRVERGKTEYIVNGPDYFKSNA